MLSERANGLDRISVMNMEDGDVHEVAFPDPVYTAWIGANAEFETNILRYGYTSLIAPATDVDYDMNTRKATVVKAQPVLGGYDPSQYTSARRMGDGTRRRGDPDLDRVPTRHAARRFGARVSLRLRLLRILDRSHVPSVTPVIARPRVCLHDRARPRWRRDGPGLVREGSARVQGEHVHRLHRRRRASHRAEVHERRSHRGTRWQRRRLVDGRDCEHAPRAVRRDRGRGPLRRRRHDDARSVTPAHDHRVGRVGRSPRARGVRADEVVLALRQRHASRRTRRCS